MGGDHLPIVSPYGEEYQYRHRNSERQVEVVKEREPGYKDSEPVYQEIGEMIKNRSDNAENSQNICDKKEKEHDIISEKNEKASVPKSNVTLASDDHPKHNIVYGMITAKEVAKYIPCTENGIVR